MKNSKVNIRKLKNNKYEVGYTDPFSKKRIRKRANTYEEAKKLERQVTRMFENTTKEHLQLLTIKELMEMHIQLTPNSSVDSRTVPFDSFMSKFEDIEIRNLSPSNIKQWMEEIKTNKDYAEITMAHIKGNLNHFFRFLVEEGIISKSPLDYYKVNRNAPPKNERIFYTQEEIQLYLEKAKEYSPDFLYPFLMLLVHTGVRRKEAVELTWKDVDLAKNILYFTDVKNGTRRPIRMSPSLRKLIEKLGRDSKYVCTNPIGERICRSQLYRHMLSLNYTFNFSKPLRCHSFRHSFAYNFLKSGGQMYELMAVLGHKNIGLTINLYGQLRSEDIEDPSPYSF